MYENCKQIGHAIFFHAFSGICQEIICLWSRFTIWSFLNLFHANIPFLYPLKTSENFWFSGMCVWGEVVKKWSIAMKWISNLIDSTKNSCCRKDIFEIKDFIKIVLFYVKIGLICMFRNDHAEHILPSIGKIEFLYVGKCHEKPKTYCTKAWSFSKRNYLKRIRGDFIVV